MYKCRGYKLKPFTTTLPTGYGGHLSAPVDIPCMDPIGPMAYGYRVTVFFSGPPQLSLRLRIHFEVFLFHHELGILWFLVCLSTSLIRFDGRVPWLLRPCGTACGEKNMVTASSSSLQSLDLYIS